VITFFLSTHLPHLKEIHIMSSRLIFVFVAVLALLASVSAMEVDEEAAPLSRPLIDGVLSSPYKRGQLTSVADIIKAEPAIAKLEKQDAEDEWNGEEDGADRFAYEKKLKEELRSLISLVAQSKEILKALPSKELRIEQVKNKLEALHNEYAKEDAIMKYKQQKALMKKIATQELALKERVDALKSTEGKLQGNIVKHKRTLRDVGVREAEMKILDM